MTISCDGAGGELRLEALDDGNGGIVSVTHREQQLEFGMVLLEESCGGSFPGPRRRRPAASAR